MYIDHTRGSITFCLHSLNHGTYCVLNGSHSSKFKPFPFRLSQQQLKLQEMLALFDILLLEFVVLF